MDGLQAALTPGLTTCTTLNPFMAKALALSTRCRHVRPRSSLRCATAAGTALARCAEHHSSAPSSLTLAPR